MQSEYLVHKMIKGSESSNKLFISLKDVLPLHGLLIALPFFSRLLIRSFTIDVQMVISRFFISKVYNVRCIWYLYFFISFIGEIMMILMTVMRITCGLIVYIIPIIVEVRSNCYSSFVI